MNDQELLSEFVEEARDNLGGIETQLLQIEALGEYFDDYLVNTVFRSIHSIKGAAGFIGLTQINAVAHCLEDILGSIREHKLIPNPFNVDVMLKAADRLKKLIENVDTSNETDNSELCAKLEEILKTHTLPKDAPTPIKTASDLANIAETPESEIEVVDVEESQAYIRRDAPETKHEDSEPAVNAVSSAEQSIEIAESGLKQVSESLAESEPEAVQSPVAKTNPVEANPPKSVSTPQAASPSAGENSKVGTAPTSSRSASESTIRVNVRVLDQLMNLAGELVLSRNQLLRALSERGRTGANLDSIARGLDQVTTDLQETIMQTRMQPIGNVFNKFPRVIRDLSASLNKKINLIVEGAEVETDKTIVEAIADPLTHLVRNSCDHGIEEPAARLSAGKVVEGTVKLKAFHQAGKVMIEISDDGKGMDPAFLRQKAVEKGVISPEAAKTISDRDAINLIFAPGFSTAATITAVSGRGVGMDVVRTNIEAIGGSVEVASRLGYGSTIIITLPLTLAIVPSMIVSVDDRRYALPQSNIIELVRTNGQEKRVERVSNAEMLRLRGALIPLIRLREILDIASDVPHEVSRKENQFVVVESGRSRYALAVDRVMDSEEIVVKPLGRHLSCLPLLAGSTILGDGRVAMILDIAGIANRVAVANEPDTSACDVSPTDGIKKVQDLQRFVLFSMSPSQHFAVSMDVVSRIERVAFKSIDTVGNRMVLQYRGGTLPLVHPQEVVPVGEIDQPDFIHVIVYKVYGHEVGLVVPHLDDICDCEVNTANDVCIQPGVAGLTTINGRTTRIVDLYGLTEQARPEWFVPKSHDDVNQKRQLKILICEDSPFFRNFLTKTMVEEGHKISAEEDGEAGWKTLSENPNAFDLLLTDIEMPRLDGLALTRRVRDDGRFAKLPIIALTSLADAESIERGLKAGVNDYQVKMNKPELLASIQRLTVGVKN